MTQQRQRIEAEQAQEEVARVAPDATIEPDTYMAAGRLFESQGQIEKAIIQYRKALSVRSAYVPALNRLGVLLGSVGRHAEAEAMFQQALAHQPRAAHLHNNLGFEYALQGRWNDAEGQLRAALELAPKFSRAYINLGMVQAKQGRYQQALATFQTVLPEADAWYNLGLMFQAEHRYQDAADAFQRVLALNSDFAVAQTQLAAIEPKLELSNPLEPRADLPTRVAQQQSAEVLPEAAEPEVLDRPQARLTSAETPVPASEAKVELADDTKLAEAEQDSPSSAPDDENAKSVTPTKTNTAPPAEDVKCPAISPPQAVESATVPTPDGRGGTREEVAVGRFCWDRTGGFPRWCPRGWSRT